MNAATKQMKLIGSSRAGMAQFAGLDVVMAVGDHVY